jgi:hypothetical protein
MDHAEQLPQVRQQQLSVAAVGSPRMAATGRNARAGTSGTSAAASNVLRCESVAGRFPPAGSRDVEVHVNVLQTATTIGTFVERVFPDLVDLVRLERRPLMPRTTGLPAPFALTASGGIRSRWFDNIAGRRLGRVAGVLTRDGDRLKTDVLPAEEFLRRFPQHVLPEHFPRIRHYGLLANCVKGQQLARCRQLLGTRPPTGDDQPYTAADWMRVLLDIDITRCSCCSATLYRQELQPAVASLAKSCLPHRECKFHPWDTS